MVSATFSVRPVSRSATEDEIKNAYRRLAKKYHPDLNPGDAEAARRMNEVNAAYDQLKNPEAYARQQQAEQARQQARQQTQYDPFMGYTYDYRQEEDDWQAQQSQWNQEQQYYRRPVRAFGLIRLIILFWLLSGLLTMCNPIRYTQPQYYTFESYEEMEEFYDNYYEYYYGTPQEGYDGSGIQPKDS